MTLINKQTKGLLSRLSILLAIFFSAKYCYATAPSIPVATLKNVTITDSAFKNVPPTASINYMNNDGAYNFNFDATGSSDSDGTIDQYKWDFGDGANGTGVTASHEYSGNGDFPVTLTVVDNSGAVALQRISLFLNIVGNQQVGSQAKNIGQSYIWAYKLPEIPSHDGTLASISMTLSGGSVENPAKVRFALYTQDPVNNIAGAMVPNSVTIEGKITSSTPKLVTLPIESGSPEIKAGTQYWIVFQTTSSWLLFYRDYDKNALSYYKITTTPYQWDNFNVSGLSVDRYKIGECYFTAK